MKQVRLHNSDKFFTVDDKDYQLVNKASWSLSPDGYVRATVSKNNRMFVHRYIMNAPKGKLIDHIDGNPLNNTRENLRVCIHNQNTSNSFKKAGLSVYKGVSYDKGMKRKKRWMARLEHNNKNITIGRYLTEDEAALAYNKCAYKIWGKFCVLNDVTNRKQKRGTQSNESRDGTRNGRQQKGYERIKLYLFKGKLC